jgi:hypothetical protein
MQSTEELATTVDGWVNDLVALHAHIGRHFVRAEPRQHALPLPQRTASAT